MKSIILPNGNLLIPVRAEGKNGERGDGMKEVEKGSEEYEKWLPFAEKN